MYDTKLFNQFVIVRMIMGMNVPQSLNRKTYYRESHMCFFKQTKTLITFTFRKPGLVPLLLFYALKKILSVDLSIGMFVFTTSIFENNNKIGIDTLDRNIQPNKQVTCFHLKIFRKKAFVSQHIILLSSTNILSKRVWSDFNFPTCFKEDSIALFHFHCI